MWLNRATHVWRQEHIGPLCPELRQIVNSELASGNEIIDTSAGWPKAGAIFVLLKKPFASHDLPPGVVYRDVNDPHWWKAEYAHEASGHMIAGRFSF